MKDRMWRERSRNSARVYRLAPLAVAVLCAAGCSSTSQPSRPVLEITRVPVSAIGGPADMDTISGRARNAVPGEQVVLYAHSGVWWLQPLIDQPYTKIHRDATWSNLTHLGSDYAALLVEPGYQPASKLPTLPSVGNGVLAIAVEKGRKTDSTTGVSGISFSGYQWFVQSGVSDHGGQAYAYDPANAWTDEKGYLHLRMAYRNGRWSCGEISLSKNLGYGTYTFVVQDSAHLRPTAVMGMFTWDDGRSTNFRNEMDIELSRWGDPRNKNAQFVVQPFYAPQNLNRFETPAGRVTYSLQWQPGKATFQAAPGDGAGTPIQRHTFTSSVPTPGDEKVHIDLYDFQHAANENAAEEAVIEKFTYHPL